MCIPFIVHRHSLRNGNVLEVYYLWKEWHIVGVNKINYLLYKYWNKKNTYCERDYCSVHNPSSTTEKINEAFSSHLTHIIWYSHPHFINQKSILKNRPIMLLIYDKHEDEIVVKIVPIKLHSLFILFFLALLMSLKVFSLKHGWKWNIHRIFFRGWKPHAWNDFCFGMSVIYWSLNTILIGTLLISLWLEF